MLDIKDELMVLLTAKTRNLSIPQRGNGGKSIMPFSSRSLGHMATRKWCSSHCSFSNYPRRNPVCSVSLLNTYLKKGFLKYV